MQTTPSTIWTRIAMFISFGENYYITNASDYLQRNKYVEFLTRFIVGHFLLGRVNVLKNMQLQTKKYCYKLSSRIKR